MDQHLEQEVLSVFVLSKQEENAVLKRLQGKQKKSTRI
jgi:hypothetical protein